MAQRRLSVARIARITGPVFIEDRDVRPFAPFASTGFPGHAQS
jgi:hypothetical protein